MSERKEFHQLLNKIKGRTGETIVQGIFKNLNMLVHNNGIEATHPHLASRLNNKQFAKEVDNAYRSLPDFIVERSRNGQIQLYYIEVKFSKYGLCEVEKIIKYNDNVIFVFLDTHSIWTADKASILLISAANQNSNKVAFTSLFPLTESPHFLFTPPEKEIILQSIRLATPALEALVKISEQNQTFTKNENIAKPDKIKPNNGSTNKKAPKHRAAWGEALLSELKIDFNNLIKAHRLGIVIDHLAEKYGRTKPAIRIQLKKLRLITA